MQTRDLSGSLTDGKLQIRYQLIPLAASSRSLSNEVVLLKLSWQILEVGEFNEETYYDHPLAESISKVRTLKAFSIMPDSVLLGEKNIPDWEPVIGEVAEKIFAYESLRRRSASLLRQFPLS